MNSPLDKTFMKILLITFGLDFLIEKEREIFDFGALNWLMPSPFADSKFVLSIPKIFKHTQFFNHTQNVFGILKSGILLHKLDNLSIHI